MSEAAIDYLAMAEFLKPRGYRISGDIAIFPGGLSAVCADMNDAYQMAFGHFLAGELGRKWKAAWERDTVGAFYERVFSEEEFRAIIEAIRHYEALEAQE